MIHNKQTKNWLKRKKGAAPTDSCLQDDMERKEPRKNDKIRGFQQTL